MDKKKRKFKNISLHKKKVTAQTLPIFIQGIHSVFMMDFARALYWEKIASLKH